MNHDRALRQLDLAIEAASATERAGLVVQLAARVAHLGACLAESPAASAEAVDRNLDVEEAAQRLGVSSRYMYRNSSRLPFARRVGRRLLFSEHGLSRYLAKQQ